MDRGLQGFCHALGASQMQCLLSYASVDILKTHNIVLA